MVDSVNTDIFDGTIVEFQSVENWQHYDTSVRVDFPITSLKLKRYWLKFLTRMSINFLQFQPLWHWLEQHIDLSVHGVGSVWLEFDFNQKIKNLPCVFFSKALSISGNKFSLFVELHSKLLGIKRDWNDKCLIHVGLMLSRKNIPIRLCYSLSKFDVVDFAAHFFSKKQNWLSEIDWRKGINSMVTFAFDLPNCRSHSLNEKNRLTNLSLEVKPLSLDTWLYRLNLNVILGLKVEHWVMNEFVHWKNKKLNHVKIFVKSAGNNSEETLAAKYYYYLDGKV